MRIGRRPGAGIVEADILVAGELQIDRIQARLELLAAARADQDRRRTFTSASAGFQGAAANNAAAVVPPKAATAKSSTTATSYCWTHGSSKNTAHTSKTCNNKAEGHDGEATSKDKKGGSDKVWGPKIKKAE